MTTFTAFIAGAASVVALSIAILWLLIALSQCCRMISLMMEAITMREQLIVRSNRVVSASKLIDTLAESLSVIKEQDDLTDADLGAVMHKGADQGAKYRTGLAEMGAVAFLRGCERWNGRFANDVLAHVGMKLVPLHSAAVNDQCAATRLTRLLLEMSVALEDGEIDDAELAGMRRSLEEAGEAVDRMRERLRVRAA